MEEMVRNTSHVLCGQLEIWYSYAFLFSVSVRLRLRPQLFFFLFISLAFVQKSMAKKKGGNSREFQDFTDDGILYWDFSFVSFSRICVRLCSLRLSASAALGLSHSATHKYEAYDRTDVIFFINHRRKTDS